MAVGFAAQSTMQNVVSALQIYSTRPFIVGDRVQLKSMSGSTIVAGRLIPDCAALLKSLLALRRCIMTGLIWSQWRWHRLPVLKLVLPLSRPLQAWWRTLPPCAPCCGETTSSPFTSATRQAVAS